MLQWPALKNFPRMAMALPLLLPLNSRRLSMTLHHRENARADKAERAGDKAKEAKESKDDKINNSNNIISTRLKATND
jgi:hypothetical protein